MLEWEGGWRRVSGLNAQRLPPFRKAVEGQFLAPTKRVQRTRRRQGAVAAERTIGIRKDKPPYPPPPKHMSVRGGLLMQ